MSLVYGKRVRPTQAQRKSLGAFSGAPIDNDAHAPVLVRSSSIELRADTEAASGIVDNLLKGVPCRMGHAYPIGWGDYEVVFPGAFAEAIPRFMREGTILADHEWDKSPIAYPTLLEERGRDLYAEAMYHETPRGQEFRTVAKDRLAKNLMVGLSIGFFLESDSYKWFVSGAAMLEFAKTNGYDMKLFDSKQIKAVDGWVCAVTRIRQLVEYSQCSVLQANDMAEMMEVHSSDTDAEERQRSEELERQRSDDAEAKRLRDAELISSRESRARDLRARTLETLAHSQSKETL
jgi:hypothetical protein